MTLRPRHPSDAETLQRIQREILDIEELEHEANQRIVHAQGQLLRLAILKKSREAQREQMMRDE